MSKHFLAGASALMIVISGSACNVEVSAPGNGTLPVVVSSSGSGSDAAGPGAGGGFGVKIELDGYQRSYQIDGGPMLTGDQALTLAPGEHRFSNGVDGFEFLVDSSGGVSSSNPEAATALNGSLALRTTSIFVDPGQYSRAYALTGGPLASGGRWIATIPGIRDAVLNAAGATVAEFVPHDDGALDVVLGQTSVSASRHKLSFLNVVVTIDPGRFDRRYRPIGGSLARGSIRLVTIPDAHDRIDNASGASVVQFRASADGEITLVAGLDAAEASTGAIAFRTVDVQIDSSEYSGAYTPAGGSSVAGATTLVAIVGADDRIDDAMGAALVQFVTSSDGSVTVRSAQGQVEFYAGKLWLGGSK